jgi:hypothetical protein
MTDMVQMSKLISYWLRHDPTDGGLTGSDVDDVATQAVTTQTGLPKLLS